MIRQEDGQWCLFTEDGSRKLGCHPTEEEAKAQEAAIKAREGAARDSGSVRFELSDIDLTEGTFETLENGDVRKWIPLAELGEKWVNGGREFDMTPELVAQGIKNFEARGKNPLPVTFGHLDDSAAPARAWIEDLRIGPPPELKAGQDSRPWGFTRFLKDTWAAIQEGQYKYFSLEFYPASIDGKGKEIGFEFDGGAILNKPFFPSLRVDQGRAAGACFALSKFRTSTRTTNNDRGRADGHGGKVMTDEEKKAQEEAARKAAEVKTDGDKVTLSRSQYQDLLALERKNQDLTQKLEESRARNQTNEQRISQLEKTSIANRVRAAVKTLQRDHRIVVPLAEYAIDTSESECIEWLGTAPMGVTTVEGLEKLARDQEATAHLPRIPGGKEVGTGNDGRPPVDLASEAGRTEAVRRRAAQLKKDFSKEELENVTTRRRQTLEQYAAAELASDHPEYRKEFTKVALTK